MNSKTHDLPSDDLFRIERSIAQRADELSRARGVDRGHALDHWRQAEDEVWQSADVVHALEASRDVAVG